MKYFEVNFVVDEKIIDQIHPDIPLIEKVVRELGWVEESGLTVLNIKEVE